LSLSKTSLRQVLTPDATLLKVLTTFSTLLITGIWLLLILGCKKDGSNDDPTSPDTPEFKIDLEISNRCRDAGGGSWFVDVSAHVHDFRGRPAPDSMLVDFGVIPDVAGIASARTGYPDNFTRGTGLALSTLVYMSGNTFDTVTITAEVPYQLGVEVSGEKEYVLPLSNGCLTLYTDRANHLFESEKDTARIKCWVMLKDGHYIAVNNAPIVFSTNRGRFHRYNHQTERYYQMNDSNSVKHTGWQPPTHPEDNEADGQATVYLIVTQQDVFLDPYTPEVVVQLNAKVEGYAGVRADPEFVFFLRRN